MIAARRLLDLPAPPPVWPVGWGWGAADKAEVMACPACGEARATQVASRDRYGLEVAALCCAGCELVWLSPWFTAAGAQDFYRRGIYRQLVAALRGKPDDPAERGRNQVAYANKLGRFMAPLLPRGAASRRVLDIGGGSGIVGVHLAGPQGRVTVVDPAPPEQGLAEIGVKYATVPLEAWRPEPIYDLVLLCQTLDHLPAPAAALKTAKAALAPGGLLYVDIVDLPAVARRLGSLEGALKVDHPCNWCEASARRLLDAVGLGVVRARYDGMHVGFACRPCSLISLPRPATLLPELRRIALATPRNTPLTFVQGRLLA